jgi:DNA-binding transcriptional regulator LsrR (DeoR family)
MIAAPRSAGRSNDVQIRLMTKVARMYHERGIRQADIADTLHLSQARVSRLLKRAAETGIVRTVVVVSQGVHTDVEEELERRFDLLEAIVVDVEGDDQDIITGLGSAAGTYLESTVTGGERIGVSSWSQTLLSMVDRMRPFRISGADTVTQLLGGAGAPSAQAQANRLLSELAEIMGAKPTFLPAPGMVNTPSMRRELLADPAIASVTANWKTLTMALVGIGSLPPSRLLQESGNAVSPDEQAPLLAAGAVGDVCLRFFDAAGAPVKSGLDARIVGIDAETLRAIPRRIGVAGGVSKHRAIRAAVRGRWVNVLLTDLATANALLEP